MEKISVVIITKNEEKNIEACLKSVNWVDEIVIVDSGSTDKTLEIADRYNCKIIETPWLGFAKTKQLAVDSAKNNWVLSMDADEVLSSKLQDFLKELKLNEHIFGYLIRRSTYYLGHKIKYSGWQGDYPLRLFDRNRGAFNDKDVHESVKVNGPVELIQHEILHYSFPDLETHLSKMSLYAELSANMMHKKGKRSSLPSAVIHCVAKFISMYIINMGILDGRYGFLLAANSAYGVFLKYVKLWQRYHLK